MDQWLSLNLLLGSDCASTLTQVRYLGNCLKGDAQEWYVRNIEHHDRVVCKWTLESALIEMQKHFLHSLTHRYASTTYETTCQGSGTVQDLLNRLNKLTVRMVQKPDDYTQRKRFLAALCDLLHRKSSHKDTPQSSAIWLISFRLCRRLKMPCDTTWVHVNLRYNTEQLYLRDPYPQGYGHNFHVQFHLGTGTRKLLVINQQ